MPNVKRSPRLHHLIGCAECVTEELQKFISGKVVVLDHHSGTADVVHSVRWISQQEICRRAAHERLDLLWIRAGSTHHPVLAKLVDFARLRLRILRKSTLIVILVRFRLVFHIIRKVPAEIKITEVQIVDLFGQQVIIPAGFLAGLVSQDAVFPLLRFCQPGDAQRVHFRDPQLHGRQPARVAGKNDVILINFDGINHAALPVALFDGIHRLLWDFARVPLVRNQIRDVYTNQCLFHVLSPSHSHGRRP